jgi:hypothetical protein
MEISNLQKQKKNSKYRMEIENWINNGTKDKKWYKRKIMVQKFRQKVMYKTASVSSRFEKTNIHMSYIRYLDKKLSLRKLTF